MKRGIVMSVTKRKAIVLTKDGEFKKVSLDKYPYITIGEEVVVPPSQRFKTYSKSVPALSAIAAAAIFLIIILSSFPLTTDDRAIAAFVGLDINPSVEAGINKQLEVIELRALNDDGSKIISKMGAVEGASLPQLLTIFLSASESGGYLENSKDMLVTTTLVSEKDEIEESVTSAIRKWQTKDELMTKIAVTTMVGNEQQREIAQKNGISTGKYLMVLANNEDDSLSLEEAKALSVAQLNERLSPPSENESSLAAEVEEQKESKENVADIPESPEREKANETPIQNVTNVSTQASNPSPNFNSNSEPPVMTKNDEMSGDNEKSVEQSERKIEEVKEKIENSVENESDDKKDKKEAKQSKEEKREEKESKKPKKDKEERDEDKEDNDEDDEGEDDDD